MDLLRRLTADGPKRILSLDGGGIRGGLALGILERIEALLRERHGDPDLRLRDYFDLIGGTSTGAIIAGCVAYGLTADDVKARYLELGGRIFGKTKWKKWEARFDTAPLDEELHGIFGDIAMGDDAITTGLCVVTKRADTRSTWPLHNHPGGQFYGSNRHIPIRDAIRASTAAPVYFMPKTVTFGEGESGTFIDGGVSMCNNPALRLFLLATLQGYPFRWPLGEDNLLLVSVGTGSWHEEEDAARLAGAKIWDWIGRVPVMLMDDATWQNQLLLQCISRTPTPWKIDAEVGDLRDDLLGRAPSLSYLRYDAELDDEWLRGAGLAEFAPRAVELRSMSAPENRFDLATIGERVAEIQVMDEHFPAVFDLRR